jgi:hypothetical protein
VSNASSGSSAIRDIIAHPQGPMAPAGGLLVLGLLLNAIMPVALPLPWV